MKTFQIPFRFLILFCLIIPAFLISCQTEMSPSVNYYPSPTSTIKIFKTDDLKVKDWKETVDNILQYHESGNDDAAEADAIARYASAYVIMYELTGENHYKQKAIEKLDLLSKASYQKGSNKGWGLGVSWDAFYDDSVNPPDTIYSYTTAVVVRTFLLAYAILGDEKYYREAKMGVDALVNEVGFNEINDKTIVFRFSDAEADSKYRVPNASAVTAAALLEFSLLNYDPERDLFKDLAYRALNHLVKTQFFGEKSGSVCNPDAKDNVGIEITNADGNWLYVENPPKPMVIWNDMLHWSIAATSLWIGCYLLEEANICESAFNEGIKDQRFNSNGSVKQFSYLGWDLGEALIVLIWSGYLFGDQFTEKAFDYLRFNYLNDDGLVQTIASWPNKIAIARAQSWYAMASVQYLALLMRRSDLLCSVCGNEG